MRTLISEDRIAERIRELARQIDADYPPDEPLCILSVLKGAFIFTADLVRAITNPAIRIEFVRASSYGNRTQTSGNVLLTGGNAPALQTLRDCHVLIAEDIVDTGLTLAAMKCELRRYDPRSLEAVTLIDKPSRRQRPVGAKYVGFEIQDQFVVGYGLDHGERFRDLADICVLEQ